MNTSTLVFVVLFCTLLFFVCLLSFIFLRFRSRSRHSPHNQHMAARWGHMDTAERRRREMEARPGAEGRAVKDEGRPDEFGVGGGITGSRGSSKSGVDPAATGPHGTRTFLRGWFGLDEPNYSGYNNSPEQREKDANGDLLPMTTTSVTDRSRGFHRPIREEEEEEWEVASVVDHGENAQGRAERLETR